MAEDDTDNGTGEGNEGDPPEGTPDPPESGEKGGSGKEPKKPKGKGEGSDSTPDYVTAGDLDARLSDLRDELTDTFRESTSEGMQKLSDLFTETVNKIQGKDGGTSGGEGSNGGSGGGSAHSGSEPPEPKRRGFLWR